MIWKLHLSLGHGLPAEKLVCKPEKRRKAVIEFIRSARRSLLVSVFRCDDTEVLCELGKAVGRGIDVHVLITPRAKGWSKRLGPLAGLLDTMGMQVHRFASDTMKYHAKYMVADGERALVATMNLTRECLRRTRDFVLVTDAQAVAEGLEALFWADISGAAVPDLPPNIIVGPERSRSRLAALLASAQRSIRIIDHKLSDRAVLDVLFERSEAGVTVEIDSDLTGDLKPHGRLVTVDGETAVIGSFSLSESSLDTRREVAVLTTNPKLVEKLERQFVSGTVPKVLERKLSAATHDLPGTLC